MKWTRLIRLENYHMAPRRRGIYEIGFKVGNYCPPQRAAFATLSAATYPFNFMPMYVGKSESNLAKRLGEHFRAGRNANKQVRQYYKSINELVKKNIQTNDANKYFLDGLYFTCIELKQPKNAEGFLRMQNFKYSWNNKIERKAIRQAEGRFSSDLGYHLKKMAILHRDL